MNQPTHHQIATYLTDYALSELVKYVMEDTGCTIEQAMERVYNLLHIFIDNERFDESVPVCEAMMERLDDPDHFSDIGDDGVPAEYLDFARGQTLAFLTIAYAKGSPYKSLIAFLNDCRLPHAAKLLAERPDLSIADVARESGFPSADTFSRNFRQKYALTPSQFREQQAASE